MKKNSVIFGSKTKVPQAVRDWAEALKVKKGVYHTLYEGNPVYLIAAGECPTGGYRVSPEPLSREEATVGYSVISPPAEEFVIQIITYPYELVFSQFPLCFVRQEGHIQIEEKAIDTPPLD